MSIAQDLGMRIRAARMESGWSQDHLAEATGFAQAQLSRWEMGERSITVEQLIVANAMGLETATLLPGSDPPRPNPAIVAAKLATQLHDTADLIDTHLNGPPSQAPQ